MNEQKKKGMQKMVFAGVLLIPVLIYMFLSDDRDSETLVEDTATTTTSTSTDGLGVTIEGPDGVTIELVDTERPEITFDLDRPIEFTGVFADNVDAQLIMTEKIGKLVRSIEKNGGSLDEWLSLGALWKQVDDYEGAELAWNYASAYRPENHISYANLGNLYHLYTQEYEKAEQSFLTSLEKKADNPAVYLEMHSLYVNSYTQKAHLADDILLTGLENNPNDLDLSIALARYYKDSGDVNNATTYYNQAITVANNIGLTDITLELETELEEL